MNAGLKSGFETNMYALYPNPAYNKINIRLPENNVSKITITNINGQILKSVILNQKNTIDISDLPSGIFFMNINDGRKSTVKKFIKY